MEFNLFFFEPRNIPTTIIGAEFKIIKHLHLHIGPSQNNGKHGLKASEFYMLLWDS